MHQICEIDILVHCFPPAWDPCCDLLGDLGCERRLCLHHAVINEGRYDEGISADWSSAGGQWASRARFVWFACLGVRVETGAGDRVVDDANLMCWWLTSQILQASRFTAGTTTTTTKALQDPDRDPLATP